MTDDNNNGLPSELDAEEITLEDLVGDAEKGKDAKAVKTEVPPEQVKHLFKIVIHTGNNEVALDFVGTFAEVGNQADRIAKDRIYRHKITNGMEVFVVDKVAVTGPYVKDEGKLDG